MVSGVSIPNRSFCLLFTGWWVCFQPRAGKCFTHFRKCSLLLFLLYSGCSQPTGDYDPCSIDLQLETLQPSTNSFQWVPYQPQAHLEFAGDHGARILLVYSEDLPSCEPTFGHFDIICPQDSSQNRKVNYQSLAKCSELINADEASELHSVGIVLRTWLDERRSTLDRPLLSDVIEVSFLYANGARRNILRFPVLDRGFGEVFTNEFRFDATLMLNGKQLMNVYRSAASDPEEEAYYTPYGLEAIRHQGKLYLLQ